MKITTENVNGTVTVLPVGSIDSTTADQLDEVIGNLDIENVETLVIDFKEVDYISSKCLRILVSTRRRMQEKAIVLTNLNTTIADIVKLSGLSPLFEIK